MPTSKYVPFEHLAAGLSLSPPLPSSLILFRTHKFIPKTLHATVSIKFLQDDIRIIHISKYGFKAKKKNVVLRTEDGTHMITIFTMY